MKRFAALARVSSREQEREGFSLEVQEAAIKKYAVNAGGVIVKFFKVAETASKKDQRTTFKELITYAKKNAPELDGLLFYKVDRAARNLSDYVQLEQLESDYNLPFISISQPTENTPAGRMMRRTLANMASFFTEQQSVDVREGHARRVQEGWFVGTPPYGYAIKRVDGRAIVEIDHASAENVRRIFRAVAHENVSLDQLTAKLKEEGRVFRATTPRFARSTLHDILTNRSYIGEVPYHGEWTMGQHEALIDAPTWQRVRAVLGKRVYQAHNMVYASELVTCAHCGRPITGECKTKKTKAGTATYIYYRCPDYKRSGHPAVSRATEPALDAQMMAVFESLKLTQEKKEWFGRMIQAKTGQAQDESKARRVDLLRQQNLNVSQQDVLLNMRMAGEIDAPTYTGKATELRDRLSALRVQLAELDHAHDDMADEALKMFELSQNLKNEWFSSDPTSKRALLGFVGLNYRMNGVTLELEMNKPLDLLVQGLDSANNRGGRI